MEAKASIDYSVEKALTGGMRNLITERVNVYEIEL